MSERKVLNKYIPPNFDPAKIPKGLASKPKQHTVRLMAPFSMRCCTCGEFIYKGRKFNARKETVDGETYLGIKIFRFYIRCPQCGAEITFKTDPKNADYVSECGAKRNFEPWREEERETEAMAIKRRIEEENNPLKALENKTVDSKREIDIAEGLDEIRTLNARLEAVDADAVLGRIRTARDAAHREPLDSSSEDDASAPVPPPSHVVRVGEVDPQVQLLQQQALPTARPVPNKVSKPALASLRSALGIVPRRPGNGQP